MSNSDNSTVVILDQASGYLQIDMLEAYAEKYTNRVIIAGTIFERRDALPASVKWHRIVKYDRSTPFKRVLTWALGTIGMFWILITRYRKSHVVAITNPPFSIFIPWILRMSFDVVVYDMYPDALVQYKYLSEKSQIVALWSFLNKRVFQKAKRIFTLTNGMKKLVDSYIVGENKTEVVSLWSDQNDFAKVERSQNRILQQTNSFDKFVILYSGNLGLTHPIEKLLELASLLDPKCFSIVIIGEGAKKERLQELKDELGLPHVYLLPWQPFELFSHSLMAADLSVVTLDEEASDLCIPSKTYNILSAANPILALCSLNSDLATLINNAHCGIVIEGEINHAADFVMKLYSNTKYFKKLKENSLNSSKSFTKKNAMKYV
jgi:hypothetical protein